MRKELVQEIIEEARNEESNLVIWDRRDTFTVESGDLGSVEVSDDYLKAKMQDGRATVFVEHDSIYKLVIEKERSRRTGVRAGFGASGD